MIRRFVHAVFLALMAVGPTGTAADGQNYLHFQFRNCDVDRATVDVKVYNGADAATAFTITDAHGLAHRGEAGLHCISGKNPWDSGCKVHVHKGNTVYPLRIQESSCFEGRYDYWFKAYGNCTC